PRYAMGWCALSRRPTTRRSPTRSKKRKKKKPSNERRMGARRRRDGTPGAGVSRRVAGLPRRRPGVALRRRRRRRRGLLALIIDADGLHDATTRALLELDLTVYAAKGLRPARAAIPEIPDVVALAAAAEPRHVRAPFPIARIAMVGGAAVACAGFARRGR